MEAAVTRVSPDRGYSWGFIPEAGTDSNRRSDVKAAKRSTGEVSNDCLCGMAAIDSLSLPGNSICKLIQMQKVFYRLFDSADIVVHIRHGERSASAPGSPAGNICTVMKLQAAC